LATGDVAANPADNTILAEFPKDALSSALEGMALAVLMCGYDADAEGNVRPVEADRTETTFGGARNEYAPNVIDVLTPGDVQQFQALAYDEGTLASIPYIPLATDLEEVHTFEVPTGEGYGPGTYEYPTSDDFYEGAWDLEELTVSASRDHVEFAFTMETEVENPWALPRPFSHQFFQVYVYDPESDGEEGTEGREGLNANMAGPYHYRVVVNGETTKAVESADGDTVTSDVDTDVEDRTVAIRVPADSIGWDEDADGGIGIVALVAPFDGFPEGSIRAIASEPDEYVIGGGTGENDPAVMDMVTPEDVDRTEVLSAYDEDSAVELPFVALGDVELPDVPEDDDGDDEEVDDDGEDHDDDHDETDDTADDVDEDDTVDDGDDGTPGFGAAAGAAGVAGGAAYAAKRMRERSIEDDSNDA